MAAGSLNVVVTADNSGFVAQIQQMANVSEREARRAAKAIVQINDALQIQAKSAKAANDANAGIEATAKGFEHVGFASAGAKRELLELAHELSQGNYARFGGSLMVLAERTNAMEIAFSAAGAGIGAFVLTLGIALAAIIAGASEATRLTNSLVATGNAAGVTADSFASLAKHAAEASGATVGSAKETEQALIGTGRIYAQTLGIATEASLSVQRVTGQSADQVAADFAKMGDGVAKWAADYNKHAHFVTLEEFKRIKAMEDAGRAEDAQRETLRLLNEKLKEHADQLGYVESAWQKVKEAASSAWNAMLNLGKPATIGDQIDRARTDLALAEQRAKMTGGADRTGVNAMVEAARTRLNTLLELQRMQERAAQTRSQEAQRAEQGISKLMEKAKKVAEPEQHDPLESRLTAFRQAELRDNEKVNQALREQNLKAYQDEQALAAQKEQERQHRMAQLQERYAQEMQRQAEERQRHDRPTALARDDALYKYLYDVTDSTRNAEALVSGSMKRMEDAIVNFAKTGKLSFSDLFGFMAEEYLRNAIRMAQARMFTDSAGNFLGLGSLFSSVAGFLGFGHANGLDYVPYDGYPAILHQGERVQTRLEANAARSGSGATINVGAGQVITSARA